ncbi:MAG: hypothetical protein FWD87_05060 [Spirochaetaceae bacterium]|nr:hypothetical protein [Spirochaetaceae bacterium]
MTKTNALQALDVIMSTMRSSAQRQALERVKEMIKGHVMDDMTYEESKKWVEDYHLRERELMSDSEKLEYCVFLLEKLPFDVVYKVKASGQKSEVIIRQGEYDSLGRFMRESVDKIGIKII